MNKIKELVSKLNKLEIRQVSTDWSEDIPENIWNNYFEGNFKIVESGLNVDKHRHYELSTVIVALFDKFIGIEFISDLYSEQSDVEDYYHTLKFSEMQEVKVISYERI